MTFWTPAMQAAVRTGEAAAASSLVILDRAAAAIKDRAAADIQVRA